MDVKQVDKLANLIKSYKNPKIVFLNGAGISTACGIPDFRSPGTGLYDNLAKLNLPFAELVFDIDFFKSKPKLFYLLAKDIYPGKFQPSKYHYFIRHCQDHGFLKRCYTQNIDTLERLTGLDKDKIIEAHGSFSDNHCIKCKEAMSVKDMSRHIEEQTIPRCGSCSNYVKPDIVFFGESLPDIFWKQWDQDYMDIDILIVCGTSLSVFPFAGLPTEVDKDVKRVLINKEKVGDFKENPRKDDIVILGDIEEIIEKLVEKLEWQDGFQNLLKLNEKLFSEQKLKLSADEITKDIEEGLQEESEKQDIDELDKELSDLKLK